ncbi:hypothetical protein F5B20DRAFT_547313 [Whalleya microplaca]|nr:hypothetical protein F5B20DRAFT_547313 [Whalleya microplaca]
MALPRRLSAIAGRARLSSSPIPRTSGAGIKSTRRFSTEAVSDPSNRVQVYTSRSLDPFLNLSIEHFLLQKTPPDSTVLFLYANRPCVVIGRNQNPWVEANLHLLHRRGVLDADSFAYGDRRGDGEEDADDEDDGVVLVRRRSGGGTVFHDLGNMNYSVICPAASFDRDKHAEVVVRALQYLGVRTARVNERHDIVVSGSSASTHSPPTSTSQGKGGGGEEGEEIKTYKVSGSAYKLTRQRALHHGTCLLSSPHIARIGAFLRSPAAAYIKARGVESVRSPVRNIGGVSNLAFEHAIVREFELLYGAGTAELVGESAARVKEALGIPDIAKGYAELKSPDWLYAQTPQFTFSTHASASDPRARPAPPFSPPSSSEFHAEMTVRHGQITEISGGGLPQSLTTKYLHHIADWRDEVDAPEVGAWFNSLFGLPRGK